MEFIDTQQHRRKMIRNGFIYTFHKPLAQGNTSWECVMGRRSHCKARIKLSATDAFVAEVGEQLHAPSTIQCEVTKIKDGIKRRTETTNSTTQQVLSGALLGISEGSAANLPPINNIRRTIRSQRQTNENLPPNPQHRRDIPVLPPPPPPPPPRLSDHMHR